MRRGSISLPQVFERLGQSLLHGRAIDVDGIAGKDKVVMIFLRRQHLCHVLVGYDPIMHVVTHDVGVIQVLVANLHPDADRLARTLPNQMFVELPCPVWSGRVIWPLLIDECPGIRQDTMIKLGMVPGHDQCARTARTVTHRGTTVWVLRELYVRLGLRTR